MRRLPHLILILCVALTGIGLGAARGTVMLGGEVVLCTGQGVVVMTDPAGGGHAHMCPDMALTLLAGAPVLPPEIGVARDGFAPEQLPEAQWLKGRDGLVVQARGPPAGTSPAAADQA